VNVASSSKRFGAKGDTVMTPRTLTEITSERR